MQKPTYKSINRCPACGTEMIFLIDGQEEYVTDLAAALVTTLREVAATLPPQSVEMAKIQAVAEILERRADLTEG